MDRADATSALWHPFADMAAVAGHEVVLARGDGAWVWDEQGRRYVDGSASLWYANVGHGRREIRDAIVAQLDVLETFHTFGDFATRPALELAERLAGLAPQPGSKVFLTSGGGDSIDTAVKLARQRHLLGGEAGRQYVISRTNGYHGTHGIGTSILGMPFRDEFGTLMPDTSQVAWDSVDALANEIDRVGAERVAAFVFEPVIGSGGVLAPPPGYLAGVAELCAAHGILTVADVVIAGFGRLGEWLAVERFGLAPDLIVFAKGVTSGYVPLGGVIAAPSVAAPFFAERGRSFGHGATYAGHSTACAAALANLDLLAADDLVHRARDLEGPFHRRLVDAVGAHPLVGEVRGGVGLMAAIVLAPDLLAADAGAAAALWRGARDHGVLTRGLFDGVALAPPLTIGDEHVDAICDGIAAALGDLRRTV